MRPRRSWRFGLQKRHVQRQRQTRCVHRAKGHGSAGEQTTGLRGLGRIRSPKASSCRSLQVAARNGDAQVRGASPWEWLLTAWWVPWDAAVSRWRGSARQSRGKSGLAMCTGQAWHPTSGFVAPLPSPLDFHGISRWVFESGPDPIRLDGERGAEALVLPLVVGLPRSFRALELGRDDRHLARILSGARPLMRCTPPYVCEMKWLRTDGPSLTDSQSEVWLECRFVGAIRFRPGPDARGGMPRTMRWPR